jgi:hypothetical protein
LPSIVLEEIAMKGQLAGIAGFLYVGFHIGEELADELFEIVVVNLGPPASPLT